MLSGFAKRDITPSLPCTLGGFACRTEPARVLATPLYARAMALQEDKSLWILVSLDLLGVSVSFTHRLRSRLHRALGSHVGISVIATHTHGAPNGLPEELDLGLWTEDRAHVPQGYVDRVLDAACDAALAAAAAMEPALPTWKAVQCPDAYSNRRGVGLSYDARVHLLQLRSPEGVLLGGLVHLGCHPTVVDPLSYHVSWDLAGYLTEQLEQQGGLFLFANGAAGDVSTRFTRREKTEEEARRLAGEIGVRLHGACVRTNAGGLFFQEFEEVYPDRFTGSPLLAPYQTVELAGLKLLLCPGEFYTHYAQILPAGCLPVGYANGYIGYVPDAASLREPGYEAQVCRLREESVRRIEERFSRVSPMLP